jgi:hypothetical protein
VTYERVLILSIREIAATKAYTIGRRGSFKDYVDLYFVLRDGHTTLDEIMKLASEKYGDAFNSRLFLEQIVTLDDLQDKEIEFLGKPINEEEMRTHSERGITAPR